MPLICVNRGPILGGLALCLLVVAPLPLARRAAIAAAALLVALVAFYTPKVQYKMFYSGQGTLADLRIDNPDFNSSGRQAMWDFLEQGLAERPWLGQGANAGAVALLSGGSSTYAIHNDWLRVRYDYGWVGSILFAVTMASQVLLAYRRGRRAPPEARVLLYTGASCFIPFAVVMYTDNIMIYCQYFTAPHFLLLGYGYAAAKWRAQQPRTAPAPAKTDTPPAKRRYGPHSWRNKSASRLSAPPPSSPPTT
jgi:O-antigen ligase